MAKAANDPVLPAIQGVRKHLRMAEEREKARKADPNRDRNYLPGWDKEAPPGESFWDGEQWYPVPEVTPIQVLRALVKDPTPENLETARWYAEEWAG